MDANGDVEWSRSVDDTLPSDKEIDIRDLHITSAGDIVLIGALDKTASTLDDTFVAKMSATGSLLWMRTYGLVGYSFGVYDFEETSDGGFFISEKASTATEDIYLLKLDAQANIESQM